MANKIDSAQSAPKILSGTLALSLCLSIALPFLLPDGGALAAPAPARAPSRLTRGTASGPSLVPASAPAPTVAPSVGTSAGSGGSSTDHLSGSVTQTGPQRLERSNLNQPASTSGSGSGSGGSLFSPTDMNAFSTAPPGQSSSRPSSTQAVQSAPAASPVAASAGAGGSGGVRRAIDLGLGLASQIGISLSQSQAARDALKAALNAALTHHGSAQTASASSPLSSGLSSISQLASRKSFVGRTLSKQELNLLSKYDVVVVIDKSGSMNETDCPGNVSRWEWCRDQLLNFTNQTAAVFKNGITVVLFSSNYREFKNVDFSLIPQIFESNSPGGGTYMAKPLSQIFDEYFQKRDSSPSPVRKLLIEVITDGDPSDRGDLFETVSRATNRMKSADEIKLNFLQIGNERAGTNTLNKLSTELVPNDGAQFDIVGLEPFSAVETEGLPGAMVDAASH